MDDIIQIDPLGFVMFYGQLTHTPRLNGITDARNAVIFAWQPRTEDHQNSAGEI